MVGEPARELDDLERAGDLARRVGQHLPVLGGDRGAEIGPMPIDELTKSEQHLAALRERGRPPRGKRGRGLVDGSGDLGRRCEVDLPGLQLRSRGRTPAPCDPSCPA